MPTSAADRLEQKLRRLAPLPVKWRTAAKYRLVAERLADLVQEFPPDTRLPSIRTLAEIFGVTTVPIHRAVTNLAQRGVLYAQGRRGVYVAQPPTANGDGEAALGPNLGPDLDAPPSLPTGEPEPFMPVPTRCTLGVRLHLAHHRAFWRQALERFEQQYPLIELDLQPCTSLNGARRFEQFDVRELAAASAGRTADAPSLLNLSDFRSESEAESLTLLSPTMAVVHLSVPCLFYNKSLLAEHGIASPRFETFADQVRYFESLPALAEPIAETVVQPLAWLGRRVQTLLEWFKDDAPLPPEERDRFIESFQTFGRLRRTLRDVSGDYAFSADRFAEGALPLFHGWSYNYGYFMSQDLPFEFGVVPWLGSDDHLFALPLCVAISDAASHCTECVRLVRHLQGPETQRLLAATGNVPFDAQFSDSTFLARDSDPDFIRNLFERAHMHLATTPGDVYLSRHVINDELWRFVRGRVSASEALDDMLWLGRGAARQFARRDEQAPQALAG